MRQLKTAGFQPKYQSSKDDYKQTLHKRWDLVIVAGGDGTVARVARHLHNRDIPLAILPIGTANNVARALGLNDYIEALISQLPTAQPKRLDIGVARGPWGKRRFLEAVGFGTIAKAIAHTTRSLQMGALPRANRRQGLFTARVGQSNQDHAGGRRLDRAAPRPNRPWPLI